ncbi:MAG: DUF917 domain-containing protein [Anaerolineae bacterium]|nr:DUF917 domain-containing protein [Anaerolineae bacterium]
MPNRMIKTEQDCIDFLSGLKLLGTGGGGSMESGMELLKGALDEGLEIKWINAGDMADDAFSCTPYGSGSISEDVPKTNAQIEALGKKIGTPVKYGTRAIEAAVHELEDYCKVKIGALVPVELGPANTPAPMVTAARLGIPVIDGDYSGRAVPEDMQTTYFLKGVKTYPAAIVDWWGNVLILKEAATTEMGERIGKMISVASYGAVYIASILLNAADTRSMVVPGTLTLSLELGQAIHTAKKAGLDPVAAAVKRLSGWRFFEGEVIGKDWENKNGVMVGTTHIRGKGEFAGQSMDVYFLNENHVAFLDNKPYVFSPDLIILANPETCEGYTNTEIKTGDPVVVLGSKGYDVFRSEFALKYFGPRYWGFDVDYTPIEKVLD